MIRVEGLHKYFNRHKKNEFHVINNTSLEFANTGLICILGESGSGKTTLLNTIGGLDTFAAGKITVDDVVLTKYQAKAIDHLRNQKYGYIFQNYYLLMDYSVDYNIRLALKLLEVTEEEIEERIVYVLRAVDMEKYRKRLVSELSGGQQQRVAIARALAKAPEIIFADEPTGNLDEANTMRIMSIIRKVADSCLVILVTHERRIAEFFADRIIEVRDGQVVEDQINHKSATYEKSDDTNIYLKEFDKKHLEADGVEVALYSDSTQEQIRVTLVVQNGKLFIRSESSHRVVYLTEDSETELVDDDRPELDMEDVTNFEYELKAVKVKRSPNLSLKEILRMAKRNVKVLGKKQVFMITAFVATALLLAVSVADLYGSLTIEKRTYITSDSHCVRLAAMRTDSSLTSDAYSEGYRRALEAFLDSGIDGSVMLAPGETINIQVERYSQLKNMYFSYSGFAAVDLRKLDEKNLTWGTMPENNREVVLDQWVVENICDANPILANVIQEPQDIIGQIVYLGTSENAYKVTGVCQTQETSIYATQYDLFSICNRDFSLGSLEDLKKAYPGEYEDVTLGESQVLINEFFEEYMTKKDFDVSLQDNFGVTDVGTFTKEFSYDVVTDDAGYDALMINAAVMNKNILIYTSDPEKVVAFFEKFSKTLSASTPMELVVTQDYEIQSKEFLKTQEANIQTRILVAMVSFGISLIILFFTMKSNAIKRTQELVVYRLIGISNKSISLAYIFEILMITSFTQLPAVLFVSGIMTYLSGIESLEMSTSYPWYIMLGLLGGMYLMNVLVGLVPIYNILKQPPAKLAAKN